MLNVLDHCVSVDRLIESGDPPIGTYVPPFKSAHWLVSVPSSLRMTVQRSCTGARFGTLFDGPNSAQPHRRAAIVNRI